MVYNCFFSAATAQGYMLKHTILGKNKIKKQNKSQFHREEVEEEGKLILVRAS